jgi:hypothetical protein
MECFRFAARQTVRGATLTWMLALFVLCFVGHDVSQVAPNSASIEGTVRNSQGAPVPAAMVHLQSKDGVQTLAALTDGKGSYRFSALPDVAYTVRVEMSGFADRISDIIVLRANETKIVNLNLGTTTVGGSPTPSTGTPEFFDEPHFTVAGVIPQISGDMVPIPLPAQGTPFRKIPAHSEVGRTAGLPQRLRLMKMKDSKFKLFWLIPKPPSFIIPSRISTKSWATLLRPSTNISAQPS